MRNTKLLSLFIMTLILSVTIFSCETEEITDSFDIENQSINTERKALVDIKDQTSHVLFYSDSIASKKYTNSRRLDNNLVLCNDNNDLGDVSIVTSWDIFNTGPGYIDYELEQLFNFSCHFSYMCIRPGGPATETVFAEVSFQESGSFNPMTGEFDIYEYLNGNISTEKSNELKDHFACAIKEYREENFPNSFINNVDFFGDALLCTGCNGRFLRATFTLSRH